MLRSSRLSLGALTVGSTAECPLGSADCFHEDHEFLSENGGSTIDLSTLLLPGSGVTLIEALFINDRGEIAGVGHAVVLLPCVEDHADLERCDYSLKE
ncbi:MAG TPA: hypothetical protein VNO35_14985 [Steroidobacteraceae bacterium]|nr:hypothetical protein [Steroidobacteraceae bacterium]